MRRLSLIAVTECRKGEAADQNSHMEVSRLCRWISGLDLSACREIHLLHLSDACSSEFDFVRMVQRCAPAGVKVSACPKVSEV